jgi:ATP-dependent DNA helicase RecG
VKRIRDEAREGGYPEPVWEANGFTSAIFTPNPDVRAATTVQPGVEAHSTGPVGTKLALSRHQVEILMKCLEDQPLTVLMTIVGRSDRTKFRNGVLTPLLADGLLELTIPDKPRSSKQRYRLTEAGRAHLTKSEESE